MVDISAAMWWIFQEFEMTENFFWRGLAGGVVFWTMCLVAPTAEKMGDFSCITRTEVATMLAVIPVLLTAGILLGLPILYVVFAPFLCITGMLVYFVAKNKMKQLFKTLKRRNFLHNGYGNLGTRHY